jgi:hypothetical protein
MVVKVEKIEVSFLAEERLGEIQKKLKEKRSSSRKGIEIREPVGSSK